MPVVSPEKLVGLQQSADVVRNICILAHVDHGKTSLTDSLIATNGIISPKMAGKIRYLDSRPDEQIRGITMESSAISLFFSLLRKQEGSDTPQQQDHLINLIDSPGHVDFSSEVSTASRLCDGALILVDAVEGVCSQTVNVLRQTWIEQLKPLLVINKIDRLVTELRMSPIEAYSHLTKLIEQVNAVVGTFYQGERMADDLNWRERAEARMNDVSKTKPQTDGSSSVELGDDSVIPGNDNTNLEYEEKGDEDIYFEPERGNVIFSSAIDGWAFTIKQFAGFYEKKLGIKRSVLEKVLWGDFYLDPKTKRVLSSKHLKGRPLKPMFVQLVLDNIWAVYEAVMGGDQSKGDHAMVEKITKSLSLKLPNHIFRSRDPRAILTALFAAWIPLSTAVLVSVIEHLPSPRLAQESRISTLLDSSPGSESISPHIRSAMIGLKKDRKEPVVAFVSKMVSIPEKDLPENKTKQGSSLTAEEARELARKKRAEIARAQAATNGERPDVAELREALSEASIGQGGATNGENNNDDDNVTQEPERLIGFARIFSGTLEVGDEVYVLHPKFSPSNPHASPEPQKVTVTALYLLMGRGLEPLTSVPAGVVFGIGGLEGHIVKSGTLCSQLEGSVNLAGLSMGSQPIVRVALEPINPQDLGKMITGMKLLEQSDPCAAYETLESGEHLILTAGELHLERCLKDLRERFARCEIQAGAPIVPYRESIVRAEEMNPTRDKDLPRGTIIGVVSSRQISMRLRIRPLAQEITEFLAKEADCIKELYAEHAAKDEEDSDSQESEETTALPTKAAQKAAEKLQHGLKEVLGQIKSDRDIWKGITDRIISFGPRRSGPNLLIDATKTFACNNISIQALLKGEFTTKGSSSSDVSLSAKDFSDKISYAFQLATLYGPLCQEPMQGVAVFLEDIEISSSVSSSASKIATTTPTVTNADTDADSTETGGIADTRAGRDQLGRLTGEVIKMVRDSIRAGFLDWSPRLLLAMYTCEIQASTEVLGRVYGVITRRRGRILAESMNEGTPFFTIVSALPVAESFGFSDEIRKRTSGAASPQLIFSGFEMLDEDPFWVPFTEEELEDLGELADRENLAKKYMDGVRTRKGLYVAGKKLVESAEKQKNLKR